MAKSNNGDKVVKGSEQVAKGKISEPKRKLANVTYYKCKEQGNYGNECLRRQSANVFFPYYFFFLVIR